MSTERKTEFPAAARVSFGSLSWIRAELEGASCLVTLSVADVHTGESLEVSAAVSGPPGASMATAIRDQALRLLAHEIDEHLEIDGVRVRDPHAERDRCFECGRLDGLNAAARADAGRLAGILAREAATRGVGFGEELVEHLRSLAQGEGP